MPTSTRFDPARLARIDAFIKERYLDSGKLPHAQLLIAHEGEITHFSSQGAAREDGATINEASIFRIASMTKPITSVAVMQLVEQGRLALSDPVAKYLPELADVGVFVAGGGSIPFVTRRPATPMRVIDLLRHTAGFTYSFQERTAVDQPYEGCREGSPAPTEYGDGVVTPHASFLALRYAPEAALTNLAKIRADFDAYGPGGFYDAVAVRSGDVSREYLSLDQGMIVAALGNELTGDSLRDYVSDGALRAKVRPLMQQEVFASRG